MSTTLENDIFQLNFAVEKSMRYHQRRRGWYDALHKTSMLVIIICGSAVNLLDSPQWMGYLGVAVAAFAALDLVFGLSHRARDHEMLFRRFSDLAMKVRAVASEPSQQDYAEWQRERVDIEKDEPPIYVALDADCDNEVRRAWDKGPLVNVDRWSKFTMHLLRQEKKTWPYLPSGTSAG